MILAQIVAVKMDLKGNRSHRAQHLRDALGIMLNIGTLIILTDDSAHVLRIQLEIALVAALLAGRKHHRVHPVAQRSGIMPLLFVERPLGQLDLVFVDGRVGLWRIHAALAKEALRNRLDDRLKRGTRTHHVRNHMDHAVTVIRRIVEQAALPAFLRGVVLRIAVVCDVGVGAGDLVIVVLAGGILAGVVKTPFLIHIVGALADYPPRALAGGNALVEFNRPARIAALHQIPRHLIPLFLSHVLLENAVLVHTREIRLEVSVIAPHAVIVLRTGTGAAQNDLCIALVHEIMRKAAVNTRLTGNRDTGVGDVGRQVVIGQRIHLILGVAAHRAGGAAALLDGVFFRNLAEVENALIAAHCSDVDLAAGLLAGIDGAIGGLVPGDAGAALPAVLGGRGIFRPALRYRRHIMVVVAADEILDHVVGEQANLHRPRDLDRACAADSNCLELLAAQHGSHAGAAGIAEAGDHAAHGHEILARRADGANVKLRAAGLGNGRVRLKGALAPDVGGVLDRDLLVLDLEVDGLIALALDDDGVVAGVFERMRDMAAHVRVDDGIALAPAGEAGNIHAAGAGHAGRGQRADGEDGLRLRAERIGIERNLVPDDLVAKAHAADVGFILGQGVLGRDRAGRQVDAQHAAGPAVDAILDRHSFEPPQLQLKPPRVKSPAPRRKSCPTG